MQEKKYGGNAAKDMSGRHKFKAEIEVAVAPNVRSKGAKRKTLDSEISVIVCTALAGVSKL